MLLVLNRPYILIILPLLLTTSSGPGPAPCARLSLWGPSDGRPPAPRTDGPAAPAHGEYIGGGFGPGPGPRRDQYQGPIIDIYIYIL